MSLLKTKLSFIVTLVAIVGLLIVFYFKGTNVAMEITTIVGIYVVGRNAASISHGWAASKDPNADTKATIEKLEEKD
jgi:hypothetical protein